MKTIGVLGFGPQATLDFEDRLHRSCQRRIPQYGNMGYPSMVVYHCRHAPLRLHEDGSPVVPIEPDPRFVEAARRIGPLADFLVIAANGPHLFQGEIEKASGRRVLSMIDVTLKEVQRRKWAKVGVLGMGDPFVYTKPLNALGMPHETVDSELIARLNDAIMKVMEGREDAEYTATAREALTVLRARGVDGIILGCTEIPLLLGDVSRAPDLIDPLDLLVEAAVSEAMQD